MEYPKDGWTWDEFIETAKKLTNPDAGVHGCSIAANGQAFGYSDRQILRKHDYTYVERIVQLGIL